MDMPMAFKEYQANRPRLEPETAAFTAGWHAAEVAAEAEVRALREALERIERAAGAWLHGDAPSAGTITQIGVIAERALAPEPAEVQ